MENKIFEINKPEKSENSNYDFPKPKEFIDAMKNNGLEEYAEAYKQVLKFAYLIKEEGGRALLVGGSVRDHVAGFVPKDFDLEIYNLEPGVVEKLVKKMSKKTSDVGKSFGIMKIFFR
jgi:tRNA nucleotidyltransferase/poly(A) polymerase